MDDDTGAEDPQHSGPELSEGVEHLQRAARELVAAARSFLDVVEQVVEDDERLSGAASSIAELVGRGFGSATGRDLAGGLLGGLAGREPTWLRNDPDHPDAPDPDVDGADDADAAGRDTGSDTGSDAGSDDVELFFGDASVDLTVAAASTAPAADEPVETAPAPTGSGTPRTRRVTRIAVD